MGLVWRLSLYRGTMYTKVDRIEITNELGCDDYIATLAAKHASLEKAIQDEFQKPVPNTLSLAELKRKKLRVKEQICVELEKNCDKGREFGFQIR